MLEPRDYRCSLCRGPHHDRRTCAKRGPEASRSSAARRLTYALTSIGKTLDELSAEERRRVLAAINEWLVFALVNIGTAVFTWRMFRAAERLLDEAKALTDKWPDERPSAGGVCCACDGEARHV